MQYTLVGSEDGHSNITVFVPGREPLVAHSSHANFERIVAGVRAGDESVVDLFDLAQAAIKKFERLGERVTTANGRLFFDGEEVDNSLAKQVVRFLSDGVEDYKPLVAFFENVQQNPNEHSREQLYDWLDASDFTITKDGLIVGYKGVYPQGDSFVSINTGTAIVDGEVFNGHIPNHIGAVVEMPRPDVQHDPSIGCHQGLHVGTYEYANDFARGALLEVHVNPRDVVSVPTDCGAQKMRVCRYTVVGVLEQEYRQAVLDDDLEDLDEDLFCEDEPTNPTVKSVEGYGTVAVGDIFEDRDSRRAGRKLKIIDLGDLTATVENVKTGVKRSILLDRLTSRKYRKVS